jgi:hypothetical protein
MASVFQRRPNQRILLRATQTSEGRAVVEETAESCPFADDPDRCRDSLVRAWREGTLAGHCIFAGLAADRQQCRQVLRKGLYDDCPDRAAATPPPRRCTPPKSR